MRKILYLIVCVCLFGACSSVPNEREVTVSNVDITGFIKKYVKVVDGTYKFTHTGRGAAITIKIELIKKPANYEKQYSWPQIRLNAVGENGKILDTGIYGFKCDDTDRLEDLFNSNVGETKSLSFVYDYFDKDEEKDKVIFTEAASFELIDKAFEQSTEATMSSAAGSGKSKSTSSNNWDKILTEYESFVNSYVKLIKKAQNGDVSALTESAEILEKANSLSEKLSNAEDDMSASQAAKFVKLQNKIATAAM
ncbi:MAG: hypothetical protein NC410_06830 [Oscillibacter sp.]|nr:hypothetical protein [Oscillibacter sp.]